MQKRKTIVSFSHLPLAAAQEYPTNVFGRSSVPFCRLLTSDCRVGRSQVVVQSTIRRSADRDQRLMYSGKYEDDTCCLPRVSRDTEKVYRGSFESMKSRESPLSLMLFIPDDTGASLFRGSDQYANSQASSGTIERRERRLKLSWLICLFVYWLPFIGIPSWQRWIGRN